MRSSGGHEGVEHGDIQQHAEPCRATPASGTRAGFACVQVMTTAGFSGATTDRPAPRRLLADITAGRASAIRSAASPPTSSPAVRYWNRARQRYHRLSARYSRARVSLPTQAVRPGPDNRGKPRLLDLETRIPARDRFAPDLYGAFPVKRLFWVLLTVFCSERERLFFVPSPAIRFAERAEGVKGPKR